MDAEAGRPFAEGQRHAGAEATESEARGPASSLERLAVEMSDPAAGAAVSAAGSTLAVPELGARALILRLARDVAHAGERQEAPLATYLVGRYVQRRLAAGVSENVALEEAARMVARVLEA